MGLPILVPRHLFGDVGTERRRIGEVEIEFQQIAQPHRLGPEGLHPVAFGVVGVRQCEFDDRGLQEGVDHRVPVERRGEFVVWRDVPDRFAAAVDTGDRMPIGQGVHRRAHTFARAQP